MSRDPAGKEAPRLAPANIPLALYVHLPWCVRKCPYCDFNSHAVRGTAPESDYVDALLRDLGRELESAESRSLGSIFFGGGTPSLFQPASIERILDGVAAGLSFAPDIEVTLEANPGTVDAARFTGFRAAGVNRLSIGVQSFDDARLRALGRIHNAAEARAAIQAARAAGFANINVDLMYGLPQQTPAAAQRDVDAAIACQPAHISAYQLTLEPNTPLYRTPPPLPADDTVAAMEDGLHTALAGAGFRRYEISAYAQPGAPCRHNLNYWRFGDYLGIGAGAHGKRSMADGIRRRWKVRHPRHYLSQAGTGAAIAGEQLLTAADTAFEFMLNALRLIDGVETALFVERTGLAPTALASARRTALARGLLNADPHRIQPTALGLRFANDLAALFLPASSAAVQTASLQSRGTAARRAEPTGETS